MSGPVWPSPYRKLPLGEVAKAIPARATAEAEPSAAILKPAMFVLLPAYTSVLPAPPPPPLQTVEKLQVQGMANILSARSPTLLTVTEMLPDRGGDVGVITTWVVVTLMLIATGMMAPPGPVTTTFVEFTVLASGGLLKVMVMAVVALTHVASTAGLTLRMENGWS